MPSLRAIRYTGIMSTDAGLAREKLETLERRLRASADALLPAIEALRELELSEEWREQRAEARAAASGLLSSTALEALNGGVATTRPPKREKSAWFQGGDEHGQ